MEFKKEEILNISLRGSEIDTFKQILEKCSEESSRIGFNRKVFSDGERKLIDSFKSRI